MKSANRGFDTLVVLFALGATVAALSANGCVNGTGEPGESMDIIDPPPSVTPEPTSEPTSTVPEPTGDNVMTVTVNGSLCTGPANSHYANEPCVSVTLCPAGGTDPSACQTIDNVLLDTGSYGLRLFKSLVTVGFKTTPSFNGTLAECVQFGDGSSEWGQVVTVGVQLANEPIVQAPIVLIDSTYATPPAPCSTAQSTPHVSPEQSGFNGVLGVGLFSNDCGSNCETNAYNNEYYTCSGTTCSPTTATGAEQVQNPVALLPRDNNGVVLQLPSVPAEGAVSLTGQMLLGIGTQPNNQPGAVQVYGADENANFTTIFSDYSATAITSFIDSGSSVLFFPPPTNVSLLPGCTTAAGGAHDSSLAGFYCPSSTQNLSATNVGVAPATTSASASFQVTNAFQFFNTDNRVSGTLADSSTVGASAVFDWGLPFFYGRNVYCGIDGKNKVIGSKTYRGPIWAY